jgi:uncharacterized membrane protein
VPAAVSAGPARGPEARAQRFPFIDALRGLAVVFMIETHTVNALLEPSLRRGTFFTALTYVNGLVAPAFLFCAGLGFAIFLSRKNDDILAFGAGFRSYLKKCLFIVFLGYSLHVPVFSLRGMIAAGPGALTGLLQVDILQVIGVTLLGLLAVVLLARSPRPRIVLVMALTGALLSWGYLVSDPPGGLLSGLPDWVLAYLSRGLSPLFTIVPWAAFLTTGFLAGTWYVARVASGREHSAMRLFALVSALLVVAAAALSAATKTLYAPGQYWYWSAEYFLVRLGSVGLAMCALWFLLRAGEGPGSRFLQLFGRESLAVYYAHLIIVYGKDFSWSFVRLIPAGTGYAACAGLFLLLTAGMFLFGRWWGWTKRAWPRAAALGVRLLVAGSLLSFLFS